MKSLWLIFLCLILAPTLVNGQKKKKKDEIYNQGYAPKVMVYKLGDSITPLTYLNKDQTRIRVVLEGGIERVKNTVYVTSKNAIIKQDASKKDEYLVIPQADFCEIIVDVKTFEDYYSVKDVKKKGKIVKEIVEKFPPKTYMVHYEKYEVK